MQAEAIARAEVSNEWELISAVRATDGKGLAKKLKGDPVRHQQYDPQQKRISTHNGANPSLSCQSLVLMRRIEHPTY